MAVKKKETKKSGGGMLAAEIGAGVLAAAAAGAGYYFYGTKGSKKHRAAAAKWAKDLKTSVIKEAKKIDKLDRKVIGVIVDRATKSYETVKNVKRDDLMEAAKELKANWKEIQAELQSSGKKGVKSVVAPVKKAAKTADKKAATKKAAAKKK